MRNAIVLQTIETKADRHEGEEQRYTVRYDEIFPIILVHIVGGEVRYRDLGGVWSPEK